VTRQRPDQTKDKGEVSVAGASGAFLASRDLRPRSRAVYGTTLARLAADVGATTPLAHLEAGDIAAFLDRHYGEAAPATWNLNRAALRSFFAFCARQGLIEGPDPSGSLEARVVRVDPDRRVIPARQLETLWRRGDIALRDKAFWRLAYDSAARAGELLGLDLADLDLDAKTAVVAGKGGIPRQVNWYTHTTHLLARLTSGRTDGPLSSPAAAPALRWRPPTRTPPPAGRACHTGGPPSASPKPPGGLSTSSATPASGS
jgi:integrase